MRKTTILISASWPRHLSLALASIPLQGTYTKNDNILFVIQPADGQVFSTRVTEASKTLLFRHGADKAAA